MNLKKYITELKRRNVFKAAIAYLLVAWLVAQVASIIFPTFNAPPYVMKTLIFILIIGFPINIILAWVYDVTPGGIKKTDVIDQNTSSSQKSNRLNIIIIGSLVIVIILLIFNQSSNDQVKESSNISNNQNTIAVLPLINISEDNSQDYFSDGVTQEIIDELAKVNTFIITAFSTTYQYKKNEVPHIDIAKNLNVEYLISGSSRVFKDSVKLSIELFNPHTNERIWNGVYNEVIDNAPTIQAKIAKQVAESLNIELTTEEETSLGIVNTDNGESFKLFLLAKTEIVKLTKEGFSNSVKLLKKALDLDPDYSQAHTLLAWAYAFGGTQFIHSDNVSTYTTEELAMPHINRAIELNANSSDIYLVRANFNMNNYGLLNDAKKDVEHALELNSWPRVPTNYCICTIVSLYVVLGEHEKAKRYLKLSKIVDPENLFIHFDEGLILMAEGNIKEGQEHFKKAAEVSNKAEMLTFFLGWSYYHDNQFEEALRILEEKYNAESLPLAFIVAYLSNAHYKLGNEVESERYRLELEKRLASGEHHINLSLAMIEASRNNKNETLNYLEKALENRESANAYMVNIDPIFIPFYQESRFINIRKQMQYYD